MLEAQFYMQEMDRRDSSRIARRDWWLEIVVIFLIGIEIVLSVVGIIFAVREGNAQAKLVQAQTGILTSLQQSSSDTVGALKGLLETTGKMNESAGKTAGGNSPTFRVDHESNEQGSSSAAFPSLSAIGYRNI